MTEQEIQTALAEPFPLDEVEFKPQSVKGNRALAICYIDARAVQDRLDSVVGVAGWSDAYDLLDDRSVACRLAIKIGENWVTKVDVGSQSEQPDGGDRMKAAFSDALKRAAVKFGIGRYLYRLPATWVDYDSVKKQFTNQPRLPAWALPAGKGATAKQQQPDTNKVTEDHPYDRLALAWKSASTDERREELLTEIAAAKKSGQLTDVDAESLRQLVLPYIRRTRTAKKEAATA